jgi:hypothetical protein
MFVNLVNGRGGVDHDAVTIGGKRAVDLTREQVYAHCAALHVPGVRPDMGRGSLIEALVKHRSMWGPEAA